MTTSSSQRAGGPIVYTRYPASSVALYNGVTVAHFGLATAGLAIAFSRWPIAAALLGVAYLIFAFAQMYLIMPFTVCPHCAYRTIGDSRCVSGLSLLTPRFRRVQLPGGFAGRAEGAFCHNNLYLGALAGPLALIAVGLVVDFSLAGVLCLVALAGLLAFRYFILFKRVACPHCAAKGRCPNAKAMGIV
jgi:hypothetical protein